MPTFPTPDEIANAVAGKVPNVDAIKNAVEDKKDEIATEVATKVPTLDAIKTAIQGKVADIAAAVKSALEVEGLPMRVTLIGDDTRPIAANVSGPGGADIGARVDATVGGGAAPLQAQLGNVAGQPFAAVISGPNGKPIDANVAANVSASVTANAAVNATVGVIKLDPIRLDMGRLQLNPNLKMTFRLCGIPLWTIEFTGNADVGP